MKILEDALRNDKRPKIRAAAMRALDRQQHLSKNHLSGLVDQQKSKGAENRAVIKVLSEQVNVSDRLLEKMAIRLKEDGKMEPQLTLIKILCKQTCLSVRICKTLAEHMNDSKLHKSVVKALAERSDLADDLFEPLATKSTGTLETTARIDSPI